MNYIYYQTKTKFSNTGDALINHALISQLRQYGKLYANCSSDIPVEFLDLLGLQTDERIVSNGELAFIRSVISHGVRCVKNDDCVYVFSGPGDMYGGSLRLVARNVISSLIFPVFRLLGVKVVRIGRSVGPISEMMAFSEWLRGLFLSHYYVRDTVSLARCHKIGIKKTRMCPDLSWAYDSNHEQRTNQTGCVMVNLRNAVFDDVEQSFIDATLEKCLEVLKELNDCMGGSIKVVVAYQIEEDAEFCKLVYERIRQVYPVEHVDHQLKLGELREAYTRVDCHISNRMHSLLAGYKYGSLPIALIDVKTHTKISATLRDSNLEDLMVDIYGSPKCGQIAELWENREKYMRCLMEHEEDNCVAIRKTLEEIFTPRVS